jgi:hypothetical protein
MWEGSMDGILKKVKAVAMHELLEHQAIFQGSTRR